MGFVSLGLKRILGQLCAKKCVNFRWVSTANIGQQKKLVIHVQKKKKKKNMRSKSKQSNLARSQIKSCQITDPRSIDLPSPRF